MNPGKELDALILQHVFKAKLVYPDSPSPYFALWEMPNGDRWTCIPPYSTERASAWKVVEKIDGEFSIRKQFNGDYGIEIRLSDGRYYECGYVPTSAPHAICLAALRACGVDLEGDKE